MIKSYQVAYVTKTYEENYTRYWEYKFRTGVFTYLDNNTTTGSRTYEVKFRLVAGSRVFGDTFGVRDPTLLALEVKR